ncbi:MAG TPA: AMMECR1 domain-containing protein [Chloroflexota bacterium]|nr:AMMECR1 domain-containing protein [Chloroflexota bacterium]
MRSAVAAATRDPRFQPVCARELPLLHYSVDILSNPEPVEELGQLDPKRYGVIVECGSRGGLLLPDLEGVSTVEMQVEIARRKAGIPSGAEVTLRRFTVRRVSEDIH